MKVPVTMQCKICGAAEMLLIKIDESWYCLPCAKHAGLLRPSGDDDAAGSGEDPR